MASFKLSYHSPLLTVTTTTTTYASSSLTSFSDISSSPNLFPSPPNPQKFPHQNHQILSISNNLHRHCYYPLIISYPSTHQFRYSRLLVSASAMTTGSVQEVLPPALDSSSEPPPVFDGTTRLYISYTCPYAQRVWITWNCKGLQDKIKLVPIDLQNRPVWYKEKVYPPNKVPSLEHNNEVKGESLDLIKFIDSNFEGPSLLPDDPAKKEYADELLSYNDSFNRSVIASLKGDGIDEAAAAFDYFEKALSKFDDGPFFLGDFSLADISYAPFIERFQPYLLDVKKYDITVGRPKLVTWIELFLLLEMNKNENFGQTRRGQEELVQIYKKRFSSSL